MRSIGLPELLVIAALGAVMWFLVNRNRQEPTVTSRTCRSCGQRIPDIGSFCPICGQKIV